MIPIECGGELIYSGAPEGLDTLLQFWAELVPDEDVEDYDFVVESLSAEWFADDAGTLSLGTTDVTSDAASQVTEDIYSGIYVFNYFGSIDRGPENAVSCNVTIRIRDLLTDRIYQSEPYLYSLVEP